MKTKENVAIKLTKKNLKKVFSLLDMFGEYCPYKPEEMLKIQTEEKDVFHFSVPCGFWCIGAPSSNKKVVKFKKLRNILAKEHLKKGDIFIGRNTDHEFVGVFNKIETESYSKLFAVSNWRQTIGDIKYENETNNSGWFEDFVRFATEEEKALLEPKPVEVTTEADKGLKVGSWYSCKVYGFDLPVILCFNGTYGSSTQYGWDAYGDWSDRIGCYKEDANIHIELSEIQVEQHLIKEAKRRGLLEGVKVQELTLSGKYYFNTVGLWSTTIEGGDIVIFNNGRWAEPIELKEVQKEVWVNVYPSQIQVHENAGVAKGYLAVGGKTVKGILTFKI